MDCYFLVEGPVDVASPHKTPVVAVEADNDYHLGEIDRNFL